MFDKKFTFLIFLSIFVIANTLNSYQKLEFTKAQQAYYTEHNEKFLETVFKTNPKSVFSIYDTLPTIAASLPYIGLLYMCIKNKWYQNYYSTNRDKSIYITIITLITTAIPSTIIYWLTNFFTDDISPKDKIYKTIKWFLDNYDSNLNANINLNLKKFIPENTYAIFDSMHEEYLIHGTKYINDNLKEFIEQIIDYSAKSLCLSSNSSDTNSGDIITNIPIYPLYPYVSFLRRWRYY